MNPALPTTALLLLALNIQDASERTFVDLQSNPTIANWQIVNDDVMGGVSASSMEWADGIAIFQGTVSLDNNGGFASVRTLLPPMDLAACDAIDIRVRGDGKRYKFTARMEPNLDSAIYQSPFTTQAGQWEQHRLPLKDFLPSYRGRMLHGQPPLDPAKMHSIGFLISDQQEGPFRLEIAWIRFATLSDRP
jgi:NADH dehydrogenase [ubiquinone] 1 alpha subcomplex assembly factor 1